MSIEGFHKSQFIYYHRLVLTRNILKVKSLCILNILKDLLLGGISKNDVQGKKVSQLANGILYYLRVDNYII